ncbi:hypothetical protein Tco_0970393 [Tanacetum coccineum]
MATTTENVIAAGFETHPPMLKKGMYDSWKTQIMIHIRGKENGEMLRDSVENGPYKFKSEITIKDTDGVTDIRRAERLEELKGDEKLRYDSDIKVVNIFILGFPMTKQEHESILYDEFDKFTSEPGESIHSYYQRFAKLINDMNMIPMSMTPMQINTKFVNHLQPEWSRFVIAAKQARNLHSVTFDQLYAFLKHNERDAKEVREMRQRFPEPLALLANTYNPPPSYINDPIASLNKAMIFLISMYHSKFPPTNNQLQTLSNPRTQATIQNSQVTVQSVQGRQSHGYTGNARNNQALGARDKMLLAKEKEAGVVLDEEQQDLLADSLEETDDFENLYYSNAIFMENLSLVGSLNDDTVAPRYDSDTLSKVYSTWIAFQGNARDLGSFGEETDKTTTLHQILEEVVHTECGDGVTIPHHGLDLWLQVQIFYDCVDYTTQIAIDYAAGGRHRKLRPEEAWETIEDLAKYKEEEWNEPIFSKKGSPDYIDANLEQELESKERRAKSLMRSEVLLPIRRIHQGRYGISVPALTKDHRGIKINMPYPERINTPYSRYEINIILWKISSMVPTPRNPQYAVSNSWIRRTDIQEKEQKESQKQTKPSTEWKGQSQKSAK